MAIDRPSGWEVQSPPATIRSAQDKRRFRIVLDRSNQKPSGISLATRSSRWPVGSGKPVYLQQAEWHCPSTPWTIQRRSSAAKAESFLLSFATSHLWSLHQSVKPQQLQLALQPIESNRILRFESQQYRSVCRLLRPVWR